MSRDSINISTEDSNNTNSEQSPKTISPNNLNETSTNVNGNIINDDAVVASSTTQNFDDSSTDVDEKKIE